MTVTTRNATDRRCTEGERLSIGGEAADIPLSGDRSRNEYAYIEYRDGHPWLAPAGPAIELRLNERRITDPAPLRDGDRIQLGGVTLVCALSGQSLQIGEDARETPDLAAAAAVTAAKPGGRRALRIGLLLVFAGLLVVAAFVFTATPVSIAVTPEPDQLELRGALPTLKFQGRFLAYPGSYRILASKAGYRALEREVELRRGPHRQLAFALDKLPGRVTLLSRPIAGASVEVDGRQIGVTPIRDLELAAGAHRIRFAAPRYQPAQLDAKVEGMGRSQQFEIALQPDWAPVSFASTPSGASLWIDGEAMGTTPVTLDLRSGERSVELRLDKHDTHRAQLTVVAGQAMTPAPYLLSPSDGVLAVSSEPDGASVTVDDRYHGVTPLEISLAPEQEHRVVLSKAGHRPVSRSVRVEAAATESLQVALAAEFGTIFVVSDPPDARLFVDGKEQGAGSQRLRMTTETHQLEFKKPGYKSYRVSVTPRAGVSKEVTATLERVTPEAGGAANNKSVTTGEGQVLRLITPGRFTMGASRREQGRRANEQLREIALTRPFYLGTKEVTNQQFRRFKTDHSSGSAYGRSLDGNEQPVVNVRWDEAAAYLNWLSAQDGLTPAYVKQGETMIAVRPPTNGYRLPTEAEWEYAARYAKRPSPVKYAWGKGYPPTGSAGNYADRAASGLLPNTLSTYDDRFAVTAPVGSFAPNPLGIFDVGGNVAEWCHDYYDVQVAAAGVTQDPIGPESGRHHVVRDAGWQHSTISELRLSFRDYSDKARQDLGFRIARYAD